MRMVVGEGLVTALAGIAIGLGAALVLTQLLKSFLFTITPTDFTTYAGVSVFLALVALAATYIPARRATRVDPMVALRCE
jgi:ABC-type antimicrobial peptide transport system permease subunit